LALNGTAEAVRSKLPQGLKPPLPLALNGTAEKPCPFKASAGAKARFILLCIGTIKVTIMYLTHGCHSANLPLSVGYPV
jgi:hypothetical protein